MPNSTNSNSPFLFQKREYRLFFISLALLALGFVLMSGGGSDNPEVFNEDVFSFRRIRLAPGIVLAGFGLLLYTIITIPKRS